MLQNMSYYRSKFYIAGREIFDIFCSCDLDLNAMTFIYELDLYPVEMYRRTKNGIPMSRLSKVIVFQRDRQTDSRVISETACVCRSSFKKLPVAAEYFVTARQRLVITTTAVIVNNSILSVYRTTATHAWCHVV